MSPDAKLIKDIAFFGFAALVMAYAALRPEGFFRLLALGQSRYDALKPNPTTMKVVQYLAGFCALGAALTLALKVFGYMA